MQEAFGKDILHCNTGNNLKKNLIILFPLEISLKVKKTWEQFQLKILTFFLAGAHFIFTSCKFLLNYSFGRTAQ